MTVTATTTSPSHPAAAWLHLATAKRNCLEARRTFYSWRSIVSRGFDAVNRSDPFMWRNFYLINAMHRGEREHARRISAWR